MEGKIINLNIRDLYNKGLFPSFIVHAKKKTEKHKFNEKSWDCNIKILKIHMILQLEGRGKRVP